jgi:hypothetical protein
MNLKTNEIFPDPGVELNPLMKNILRALSE